MNIGENEIEYKRKNKSKGITLIALVLTIIILIILAGVSIAMLTGENGILNQANTAKEETKKANTKEQVQVAVIGSIGTDGMLNNKELKDNLNEIKNISGVPEEITDESYPFSVTVDGEYSYVIKKNGNVGEVLKREGIKIGDYVDYSYDEIKDGYSLTKEESGYTINQSIMQTSGLKWKILNINVDGTVDLISETPTNQLVYLAGALGYNNGVLLINDICEKLYSNIHLGIKARNINLKDVEKKMNGYGIEARNSYLSSDNVQYGSLKKYSENNTSYPNLYASEKGSGINTSIIST